MVDNNIGWSSFNSALRVQRLMAGNSFALLTVALLTTIGFPIIGSAQSDPMVMISRDVGRGVDPATSADGRFTAFVGPNRYNEPPAQRVANDLFLYDAQDNSLTLITQGINEASNGLSGSSDITADGRFVVFSSSATNLVPGDTNTHSDIFVFDRLDSTISLVSTNQFGNPAEDSSQLPQISDDGRHVSFDTLANNLDLNSSVVRQGFTFMVVDRDANENGVFDEPGTLMPRRIVPDSIPGDGIPGKINRSAMSANGRFLAFTSSQPALNQHLRAA